MQFDPRWTPEEVKQKDWQVLLENAAKVLKRGKWVQEQLVGTKDSFCMIGAIQKAAFGLAIDSNLTDIKAERNGLDPNAFKTYKKAVFEVSKKLGKRTSKIGKASEVIYCWNDDGDRKRKQVVAVLNEVAGK